MEFLSLSYTAAVRNTLSLVEVRRRLNIPHLEQYREEHVIKWINTGNVQILIACIRH